MAHSKFDVENGLTRPAADTRLPKPHHIPNLVVESEAHEHEDAVPVNDPAPAPAGPPNVNQHPPLDNAADLASALSAFQKKESEKYGNSSRREPVANTDVELGPEDYMDTDQGSEVDESEDQDSEHDFMDQDSEDESVEEPAGEPDPRVSPDSQMQEPDQVQQCKLRSAAQKSLKVLIHVDYEHVEQVQHCEVLSEAGTVAAFQDESLNVGAEEVVLTMDHPASPELPPIELKFIKELSTQIVYPSQSEGSVRHTVAASPPPSSQLPSTSDVTNLVICQSSLEIIVTTAAADGTRTSEVSVKKAAADGSNILEGESATIQPAV